jgi:starch-binding outer membrane protein, SusD/RagB family
MSGYSRNTIVALYFLFFLLGSSCKKFVEVEAPPTAIFSSAVFSDDVNATSAVLAIYNNMMSGGGGRFSSGSTSITELTGLTGDEFINYSADPTQGEFYTNSLESKNYIVNYLWTEFYGYIYDANTILEGLSSSKTITEQTKTELQGETKFIRAFCYFYLINLFGEVPLVLSSNYSQNALAGRASKDQIYQQIIMDLKDAEVKLSISYLDANNQPTTERVRPNKYTAMALLSRVDLYAGDFSNAETEASGVINQMDIYDTVSLDNVFLKNNEEVIWSLQAEIPQYNAYDGTAFIITGIPSNVALSDHLLNAFEPGDKRRDHWVGSITPDGQTYYFPFKYKVIYLPSPTTPPTEYLVVFRLAEQYLVRAEARAEQDDLAGAADDLNMIRARAGLSNTSASSRIELLAAILHESQVEFFAEWGHRWFDLKRTDNIDTVMETIAPLKGGSWSSFKAIYPIPQTDVGRDPNLPQNPGY